MNNTPARSEINSGADRTPTVDSGPVFESYQPGAAPASQPNFAHDGLPELVEINLSKQPAATPTVVQSAVPAAAMSGGHSDAANQNTMAYNTIPPTASPSAWDAAPSQPQMQMFSPVAPAPTGPQVLPGGANYVDDMNVAGERRKMWLIAGVMTAMSVGIVAAVAIFNGPISTQRSDRAPSAQEASQDAGEGYNSGPLSPADQGEEPQSTPVLDPTDSVATQPQSATDQATKKSQEIQQVGQTQGSDNNPAPGTSGDQPDSQNPGTVAQPTSPVAPPANTSAPQPPSNTKTTTPKETGKPTKPAPTATSTPKPPVLPPAPTITLPTEDPVETQTQGDGLGVLPPA